MIYSNLVGEDVVGLGGHFQRALRYPETLHMDMTLLPTLGREDGLHDDTRGLLGTKNVLGYECSATPIASGFGCVL